VPGADNLGLDLFETTNIHRFVHEHFNQLIWREHWLASSSKGRRGTWRRQGSWVASKRCYPPAPGIKHLICVLPSVCLLWAN